MAGFAFRKNLDGSADVPSTLSILGKNSVTFQKGDLVRVNTSGVVDVCDSTEAPAGVVVSVVDNKDSGLPTDSGTNDTWTLASNNETVAKRKVKFIPALANYLWYNDADDTLSQANIFQYFEANDENDIDVAQATDAGGTFRLIVIDPDGDGDASKGLFQIVSCQLNQDSASFIARSA